MTSCYRLSGAGNDFLALAEPAEMPTPGQIRAWCRRGLSAGADGLFVLRRTGGGARMDYFNADGRAAALCVNGTRCAARLALHLGWYESELVVETGAGAIPARLAGPTEVALELPAPSLPPRQLELTVVDRTLTGWLIEVGVPHFVLLWPRTLAEAPVGRLGPPLRSHEAFGSAGTNVDFVRYPAPGRLEIRSWERGVEGETLACGTGVLAAAAVGLATRGLGTPIKVLTAGGFELTVDRAGPDRLALTGDARIVAVGTLLPEATSLPEPPAWSC